MLDDALTRLADHQFMDKIGRRTVLLKMVSGHSYSGWRNRGGMVEVNPLFGGTIDPAELDDAKVLAEHFLPG